MKRILTILCFLTAFICSCATQPEAPLPTRSELVHVDQNLGHSYAPKLERHLTFKSDPQFDAYATRIANKIAQIEPDLGGTRFALRWVVTPKTFQDFSLPGHALYFNVRTLKLIESEAELAAGFALELGHILNRHVALRSRNQPVTDQFFKWTRPEMEQSLATAVDLLYRVGFDPRGLLGWIQKSESISVGERAEYLDLIQLELRKYSPLRNPIIRSIEFSQMSERIKKW